MKREESGMRMLGGGARCRRWKSPVMIDHNQMTRPNSAHMYVILKPHSAP